LLDAAGALEGSGFAYALTGPVAVGVHSGVPRATLDIDLAVTSRVQRAAVVAAMRNAGFQVLVEHVHSVNLRHRGGEPVQLAFDPSFDPMIERAETFTVGSASIRIVTKEDLIAMKRRAAADPARRRSRSLRDQADVELLLGDIEEPDEGW
jgi:hypothetical protein